MCTQIRCCKVFLVFFNQKRIRRVLIMPRRRRRRERDRREHERQQRLRTSSQSSVEIHVSEPNHGVSITTTSANATGSASYGAVPAGSHPLLFRPSPPFAGLLKGVKAQGCASHQGELFTLKQLCFYLKEYIKDKQLYDPLDPRQVYCDKDPLGEVFQVKSFTVNDAVNLVTMNTQPVDLCYPRSEQTSTTYFSPENCARPVPSSVAAVSSSYEHLNSPAVECLLKTPPKCEQAKSLPEIERSATKRVLHFDQSPQPSTSQQHVEKNFEKSPKKPDRKRKRENARISECASPPFSRRRESSFSLMCSDKDGGTAFCLEVAASASEAESVYSVQSKETMLVKDSSDDYWFLDEGDGDDEGDGISFQIDTQGSVSLEFHSENNGAYMEEYEIETVSSHTASDDDDVGSESPQEEIQVTIQSDDFGFWADSESSDPEDEGSDHEFQDMDKWKCSECELFNRPYVRNCEKCWSLRPGWLKSDPLCPQNVACPSPRKTDLRRPQYAKSSSADSGLASSLESRLPEVSSTTRESPKPSTSVDRSKLHLTNTWADLPFSPISPKLRSPGPRFFANSPRKRTSSLGDSCDLCVICMQKPKEASIIHGKTGHQICCYVCAKRLRRRGKPCPVCRRPIQKVIKNFIL